MHPCEDTVGRGLLYDAIVEFHESQYREFWGYTLDEFLSLPQWRVKLLREVTLVMTAKKTSALDEALKNAKPPK